MISWRTHVIKQNSTFVSRRIIRYLKFLSLMVIGVGHLVFFLANAAVIAERKINMMNVRLVIGNSGVMSS